MSSTYPTTLDSLPTTSANSTPSADTHPALHNDANDAINKIEAELGTLPKGSAASVRARLDAVDTAIAGKQATLVSGTNIKTINGASIMGSGDLVVGDGPTVVACSDETTAITAGTAKVTFRVVGARTLVGVRASLSTAQTAGSIFTVDVHKNGTTVLSTKLTIDNNEKTSVTAATAAVISVSSFADDDEVTIDVDQIGTSGAKGLKVTLIWA